MNFTALVDELAKRPAMYVGSSSLYAVCAFVNGFDLARDGAPLEGFREWMVLRLNRESSLVWPAMTRLITMPDDSFRELSKEEDEECARAAMRLLSEFLAYREEVGLIKIHYDYARWLLRRRWYCGPLRSKEAGRS